MVVLRLYPSEAMVIVTVGDVNDHTPQVHWAALS